MKRTTTLAAIFAITAAVAAGGAAAASDGDGAGAPNEAAAPVRTAATPAPLGATAEADEKKRKRAELQEARRLAAIERKKERQFRQAEWEGRCVIKPAMSDEEIAVCREVRTKPAP